MEVRFPSAKGKKQSRFDSAIVQYQEQCIHHIPCYLLGLSRATTLLGSK